MNVYKETKPKKLVCYFNSKSEHRANQFEFEPESIDPFLCTNIIFQSARVLKGQLAPVDSNHLSNIWFRGLWVISRNQTEFQKTFLSLQGSYEWMVIS